MLRSLHIFVCLTMAFALQPIYPMESESADGAWSLVKKHPVFTAGIFAIGFTSCVGLLIGYDFWRAVRQKRQSEQEDKHHTILMTTSKEEEIREALKVIDISFLNGRLTEAARGGKVEDVKLCLQCGAQPTVRGWGRLENDKSASMEYCITALDVVLDHDHADVLALFCNYGVDVKTRVDSKPILLAALLKKAVKSANIFITRTSG